MRLSFLWLSSSTLAVRTAVVQAAASGRDPIPKTSPLDTLSGDLLDALPNTDDACPDAGSGEEADVQMLDIVGLESEQDRAQDSRIGLVAARAAPSAAPVFRKVFGDEQPPAPPAPANHRWFLAKKAAARTFCERCRQAERILEKTAFGAKRGGAYLAYLTAYVLVSVADSRFQLRVSSNLDDFVTIGKTTAGNLAASSVLGTKLTSLRQVARLAAPLFKNLLLHMLCDAMRKYGVDYARKLVAPRLGAVARQMVGAPGGLVARIASSEQQERRRENQLRRDENEELRREQEPPQQRAMSLPRHLEKEVLGRVAPYLIGGEHKYVNLLLDNAPGLLSCVGSLLQVIHGAVKTSKSKTAAVKAILPLFVGVVQLLANFYGPTEKPIAAAATRYAAARARFSAATGVWASPEAAERFALDNPGTLGNALETVASDAANGLTEEERKYGVLQIVKNDLQGKFVGYGTLPLSFVVSLLADVQLSDLPQVFLRGRVVSDLLTGLTGQLGAVQAAANDPHFRQWLKLFSPQPKHDAADMELVWRPLVRLEEEVQKPAVVGVELRHVNILDAAAVEQTESVGEGQGARRSSTSSASSGASGSTGPGGPASPGAASGITSTAQPSADSSSGSSSASASPEAASSSSESWSAGVNESPASMTIMNPASPADPSEENEDAQFLWPENSRVRGQSLTIAPGQWTHINAEFSGEGKSTLAKDIIARWWEPDAGSRDFYVDGKRLEFGDRPEETGRESSAAYEAIVGVEKDHDLAKTRLAQHIVVVNRKVELVGETIREQLSGRTLANNVGQQGMYRYPLPDSEIRAAAELTQIWEELVKLYVAKRTPAASVDDEIDLSALLSMTLHQSTLSDGMAARYRLAWALLQRPRLLVLDEVTKDLPKPTEMQVLKNLRCFTAKQRITVVFVTHNLDNYSEAFFDNEYAFGLKEQHTRHRLPGCTYEFPGKTVQELCEATGVPRPRGSLDPTYSFADPNTVVGLLRDVPARVISPVSSRAGALGNWERYLHERRWAWDNTDVQNDEKVAVYQYNVITKRHVQRFGDSEDSVCPEAEVRMALPSKVGEVLGVGVGGPGDSGAHEWMVAEGDDAMGVAETAATPTIRGKWKQATGRAKKAARKSRGKK
eukprot:g17657.t1